MMLAGIWSHENYKTLEKYINKLHLLLTNESNMLDASDLERD